MKPVFSASGMKSSRGHHTEDRVLPAGERFKADDRVVVERDDGLIEHLELVAIECAREIGFQS